VDSSASRLVARCRPTCCVSLWTAAASEYSVARVRRRRPWRKLRSGSRSILSIMRMCSGVECRRLIGGLGRAPALGLPEGPTSARMRTRPHGGRQEALWRRSRTPRPAGAALSRKGRRGAPGAAWRGTNVGRGAKTPVSMRDYARTRDYPRRGSPPSATTSTMVAISFSRRAGVLPEGPSPEGRERDSVWLEKRSATRLIWIPSPMMMPSFPSVVPLADSLLCLSRRPRRASPKSCLKPLFCGSPQARLVGRRRTYGGWFVKGS
jgi:hypothetical protein